MGTESSNPDFTKEEEEAMWKYVCDNIHNPETGLVEVGRSEPFHEQLWRQYKQEMNPRQAPHELCKHFTRKASEIDEIDMDLEMKVKLCFALGISISDAFLEVLKKNASVELREDGSIRRYHEKEGLQLERAVPGQEFSEEEDEAIIKFVLSRIDTTYPLKGNFFPKTTEFWNNFKKETGSERSSKSLLNRFRRELLPNFHSRKVDTQLKIKMLRALEVPLSNEVLKELRQDAVILTYENNSIDGYAMLPKGPARLKRVPKKSFTIDEDNDMWLFVLKKIRNPVTGVAEIMKERFDSLDLWEEFAKLTNAPRLPEAYRKRFSLILAPNIAETSFTTQTKVELFYGLKQPVDGYFLRQLEKNAEIEVNEYDILTRYHQNRPNGISLGKKTTKRRLNGSADQERRHVYPGFLKNPRKKRKTEVPVEDEENKLVVYEPEEDSDEYESTPRPLRASTPVDMNGNKLTLEQQIAIKEEERKQREKEREEKNAMLLREWEERRKNAPGPSEQVASSQDEESSDIETTDDEQDI